MDVNVATVIRLATVVLFVGVCLAAIADHTILVFFDIAGVTSREQAAVVVGLAYVAALQASACIAPV